MKTNLIKIFYFIFLVFLSAHALGDEYAECVSSEISDYFKKLHEQEEGKIWIDIYSQNHHCLTVLGQDNLMKALKTYEQVSKSERNMVKNRIATLTIASRESINLLAKSPANKMEIEYIVNRIDKKLEHLERLDDFLSVGPSKFVKSKDGDALKDMERTYHREYAFLLDPGLRYDGITSAWKQWKQKTNSTMAIKTLPEFYLWLEAQPPSKQNFPLAPPEYRDHELIEVQQRQGSFFTERYGDFRNLQNFDQDEVDEEGGVAFLYVLSKDNALYIAQSADLKTHSLLLHGAPIKGAGMLSVKDGKIIHIDNASGHYKPQQDFLYRAISTITSVYGEHIFTDPIKITAYTKRMTDQIRAGSCLFSFGVSPKSSFTDDNSRTPSVSFEGSVRFPECKTNLLQRSQSN